MDKIIELQRKRAALIQEARSLVENCEQEKRVWGETDETRYSAIMAEVSNVDAAIAREQKLLELETSTRSTHVPAAPVHHDPQPQDEKRFKSLGEQLRAVIQASEANSIPDSRLIRSASGMNEGIGSEGGFLVQTDFVQGLLTKAHETGLLASRCKKIPISGESDGLSMNVIDESSRANGSRWGGIVVYWRSEADTVSASKPKFRKLELQLEDLMGLCYATRNLLKDTTALEAVISQGFAEEFGYVMDDGIVTGNGSGQFLGILNSPCLVSVDKEVGQVAKTIVPENIIKMWARMWARSRTNAVWLINQDIEPQLNQMAMIVGTGGVPVYLPAGGLSASPFAQLFGRPVIPIEQCKTLGTVGDILLADFSQYLLIDKGAIEAAQSLHVKFLYDEQCFRFIYRVNGQPLWNSALTPANGTNTLSPFIALATRA